MKTYKEAIDAAVAINMSKRFNDVQSAFNMTSIMLIADLYDTDVNDVSVHYVEALSLARLAEERKWRDERRAASKADHEERRLANLAKKAAL